MTERHRLPNRRPQLTERVIVGAAKFDVSIGLDPDAGSNAELPREVFIEGPKAGSDMAFVLADASVLISIARQYGIPASELARSMSRIPLDADGYETAPGSAIGAAVDLLARIEKDGLL